MAMIAKGAATCDVSGAPNTFHLADVEQALAAVSAEEAQQQEALVAEALKTAASAQQALEKQLVENARLELTSQQKCAELSQNLMLADADKKQLATIVATHEKTIATLQAQLKAQAAELQAAKALAAALSAEKAARANRVKELQNAGVPPCFWSRMLNS